MRRIASRGSVWIAVASAIVVACGARSAPVIDEGEGHAGKARAALVGTRPPATMVEMIDGKQVALDDVLGKKPIYLKFWATWCIPCKAQMPHLEAAYRKYGDQIAFFAVDLGLNDSIDAVREFQAAQHLTMPIAFDRDGSLAERFHVAVTPQHILIDRTGVIRYVGHNTTPELDGAIEGLVAAGGPSLAPAPQPAPASATLPPLKLIDGTSFTVAAHAGAPIALSFVTTWCDGYLRKSRPAMADACVAHAHQVEAVRKAHPGVVWISIAHPVWTAPDELDAYRKRLGVGTPIGLDDGNAWFHHYRVRDVPTTVILDEHGVEIQRVGGAGDQLTTSFPASAAGAPAR